MREIEQLINLQNEAFRMYVHSIYYKHNILARDCYIGGYFINAK